MINYGISSIAALLFAALPMQAQLSQDDFRTPPLQARPSGLWAWLNGHVDHAQLTRELEEMKAKGMRGAIIWDVGSIRDPDKIIPAGPEFLRPESLKAIPRTPSRPILEPPSGGPVAAKAKTNFRPIQ